MVEPAPIRVPQDPRSEIPRTVYRDIIGTHALPVCRGFGRLVFIGAVNDNRFRAFDSKTGKELWAYQMAATGNANPMAYQAKNGTEYVAIVAGDTLNVFGLR